MQQIQLIGRLGQDCKVIDSNGRKFVSFSLAVDDDYKDQSGTSVDRTAWYDCTMDNTNVSNYLKKGTQVFIQGKPRIELYTSTKDNKTYGKIRVAVSRVQLLGSASATTAGNDLPPVAAQAAPVAAATPGATEAGSDDLPF